MCIRDRYNDGLIYQGERIINWDPEAMTALSNIEVIHKEIEGAMYYFKYKVVETGKELVIATTRPETMFADQAIFVHPDDCLLYTSIFFSKYAHVKIKTTFFSVLYLFYDKINTTIKNKE